MTNTIVYTSDSQIIAEFEHFNERIQEYRRMEGDRLPGMEGFFSRIWHTVLNIFKGQINRVKSTIDSVKNILSPDWPKYCEMMIDRMIKDPSSNEHFTGTAIRRATKQQAKSYITCLKSVTNMLINLDQALLSTDKNIIPVEIANVIRYLESNKCKVDVRNPRSSKSATRLSYSSVGRLGTSGYGSELMMYLGSIKQMVNEYKEIYSVLTDVSLMSTALEKTTNVLEHQVNAAEGKSDQEKAILSEQLNNLKLRLMAAHAVQVAALDFFMTTLKVVAVTPLWALGKHVGKQEDLISWIFATSDD